MSDSKFQILMGYAGEEKAWFETVLRTNRVIYDCGTDLIWAPEEKGDTNHTTPNIEVDRLQELLENANLKPDITFNSFGVIVSLMLLGLNVEIASVPQGLDLAELKRAVKGHHDWGKIGKVSTY